MYIFICLVQFFTIVTEDKKTLTQIEVNIKLRITEKLYTKKHVDSNASG